MELRTLLCIAFLLHCTQQTGIFLHWCWNKSSDAINDPKDVVDDKILSWNMENKLGFSDENTKITEKAYANFMNLFINAQNDNKNFLMVMARIENLINQNAAFVVRYNNTLNELKKMNNTIHSISNGIESMLDVFEQKLEWINGGVNNNTEQLNRLYQGAQHIFYLLSAIIVAAFLQAPFVTRVSIIFIVPLNIIAFFKHGSMEDCLGFASITVLICFITAVNFLMQKRKSISYQRASIQLKVARFLIITKSRTYDYFTPLNVTKGFFDVLRKILIILKDLSKPYWQIAVNWFRHQNLVNDTKTSNSEVQNSNEKEELQINQLVVSKVGGNCLNDVSINATHETYDCDPKKQITVVEKSHSDLPSNQADPTNHTDKLERNLAEPVVPKEPSSTSVQRVMKSDEIRNEDEEKLVQFPTIIEDRTNHVNKVKVAEVTPNATQEPLTKSSSIEYDLPLHGPFEKQREKATTDDPSMSGDQAKDTSNVGDPPQQTQPIHHRVARIKPRSNQTSSDTQPSIAQPFQLADPSDSISSQAENRRSQRDDSQSAMSTAVDRRSQPEARQVLTSGNNRSDDITYQRLMIASGAFPGYLMGPQQYCHSSFSGSSEMSQSSGLCGAMTQKGAPCRNKPSYGGSRCWIHGSSGPSGICGAMTQRGTPCRNKPSYGGPRCWRH